jgi:hypothetical protein
MEEEDDDDDDDAADDSCNRGRSLGSASFNVCVNKPSLCAVCDLRPFWTLEICICVCVYIYIYMEGKERTFS